MRRQAGGVESRDLRSRRLSSRACGKGAFVADSRDIRKCRHWEKEAGTTHPPARCQCQPTRQCRSADARCVPADPAMPMRPRRSMPAPMPSPRAIRSAAARPPALRDRCVDVSSIRCRRRFSCPLAHHPRAAPGDSPALATSAALPAGVSSARSSSIAPASCGAAPGASSNTWSCRDNVRFTRARSGTPFALKKSIVSL